MKGSVGRNLLILLIGSVVLLLACAFWYAFVIYTGSGRSWQFVSGVTTFDALNGHDVPNDDGRYFRDTVIIDTQSGRIKIYGGRPGNRYYSRIWTGRQVGGREWRICF